jgi:hypothetical protein
VGSELFSVLTSVVVLVNWSCLRSALDISLTVGPIATSLYSIYKNTDPS